MATRTYDFGGYATRNDLECTDGLTIRKNAFKNNNGKRVSLVWMHHHNDPDMVLGHADLENREDGVYAYCSFNKTDKARTAKELVANGDIKALSIFAGNLRKKGRDVLHGDIKEVSLVLAGANPGAGIDDISFAHSDEMIFAHSDESMASDEGIFWIDSWDYLQHDGVTIKDDNTDDIVEENEEDAEMANELEHADSEKTVEDVINTMNQEQKDVLEYLVAEALKSGGKDEDTEEDDETVKHADTENMTIQDVIDSMTKEQKNVLEYLVAEALKSGDNREEEMKHNAFDHDDRETYLAHADMLDSIVSEAASFGSLKKSYLAHAAQDEEAAEEAGKYGIEDIDWLHEEPTLLNKEPGLISRPMEWVDKVLNNVHTTPFSRIKSMFADIREDEARAKGYIKGKRKKEEVFSLLKRTTIPTTIYKKQKLDRDDVTDIVSFNVVAFVRAEMEVMLKEEKARAILVGDGRMPSDEDHISEDHIRPIWKDDDLYSVKVTIPIDKANATDDIKADKFIEGVIRSRKHYKGSGNPTLFTTEDRVTSCLLLKDKNGRFIYESVEQLKNVLRVKEIVTVPVMENLRRDTPTGTRNSLEGIIVNLTDYNVGANPMGRKNFFDDFDIDYNQMKYLLEERFSGALIKPFSALVIEFNDGTPVVGE